MSILARPREYVWAFGSLLLLALATCQHTPAGRTDGAIAPFEMERPDVVLLVTSNLRGVLEPCYCSGEMYGGLSRRASLVATYRRAFPRTMLVDAGDALAVGGPGDPRNRYVVEGFRQLGYDALVLGFSEWTTAGLDQIVTRGDLKFVSTTVASRQAELPLDPHVERVWGPVKLAVLSFLARDAGVLPDGRARVLRFAPEGEAARRVKALKQAGYAVVVVVNGNDGAVEQAARTCDADLIVQGHFEAALAELRTVAGRPTARTGGYEHVSVFALAIRDGKITDIEHRYERVDKRWAYNDALLDTYDAYANAALVHAQRTKKSEGRTYVGSAACADCHAAQYDSWKGHSHAHAYRTLLTVARAGDPDCLACHTSGFTSTRGFYSMERTPELANVNCQDCHVVDFDEHAATQTAPEVTEETCRRCHTKTTDPKFDFEKRRAHVGCCD